MSCSASCAPHAESAPGEFDLHLTGSLSVKCPLCGKQTPEKSFHPETFVNDIRVVDVVGLGRGRGFANSDERSALANGDCWEVVQRIADRSLEMVGFLYEEGWLGQNDVIGAVGVGDVLDKLTGEIAEALEEDPDFDWRDMNQDPSEESTKAEVLSYAVRRMIERLEGGTEIHR